MGLYGLYGLQQELSQSQSDRVGIRQYVQLIVNCSVNCSFDSFGPKQGHEILLGSLGLGGLGVQGCLCPGPCSGNFKDGPPSNEHLNILGSDK